MPSGQRLLQSWPWRQELENGPERIEKDGASTSESQSSYLSWPRVKLPTFLIIGAHKGGSTTLYDYVRGHPNVFLPRPKEPHFFSRKPLRPELGTLDGYARMFEDAGPDQLAIGEASTGYLALPEVPANVHATLPDVRLVAVLRNPVERSWSAWRWMRATGRESRNDAVSTITENVESGYLRGGRYRIALLRWLTYFPREQLRVFLLEDLEKEPNAVMTDLFTFIGVTPIPVEAGLRSNPTAEDYPMPAQLHNWLVDFYRDDISFVEGFLGRDLSHWRRRVPADDAEFADLPDPAVLRELHAQP
jgi:hypothetical protein